MSLDKLYGKSATVPGTSEMLNECRLFLVLLPMLWLVIGNFALTKDLKELQRLCNSENVVEGKEKD